MAAKKKAQKKTKTAKKKKTATKKPAKKKPAKKNAAKKKPAKKKPAKKKAAKKKPAKKKARVFVGPPLTEQEATALASILDDWDAEQYDNAGDFLTDVSDFHSRPLGALQKRHDAAVDAAADIMMEVYGAEE